MTLSGVVVPRKPPTRSVVVYSLQSVPFVSKIKGYRVKSFGRKSGLSPELPVFSFGMIDVPKEKPNISFA